MLPETIEAPYLVITLHAEISRRCFSNKNFLDTCTFNAAVYLKDFLLQDRCYIEKICSNISKCLVVYRKNGLPDADFWKNTCREFIKLYEKERL